MIPCFAHKGLAELIVRYLVYIWPTEEFFAHQLWGYDAYRIIHTYMFWHGKGVQFDEGDEFSPILKAATARYLGLGLACKNGDIWLLHWASYTSLLLRHLICQQTQWMQPLVKQ